MKDLIVTLIFGMIIGFLIAVSLCGEIDKITEKRGYFSTGENVYRLIKVN